MEVMDCWWWQQNCAKLQSDHHCNRTHLTLLCSSPHRGALSVDIRRLSVRQFVLCLTLSREWNGIGSWKLAERKSMTWVVRDPIHRLKGQRSRSLGRLMLRRKMCHMFWKERPTNFKLGTWMEYDESHHRYARWPQRLKVKVIISCRQFDACLPRTWQRKLA